MAITITIESGKFNPFCEVSIPCRFNSVPLEELPFHAEHVDTNGQMVAGLIEGFYLWADLPSRTCKWLDRDQHEARKKLTGPQG